LISLAHKRLGDISYSTAGNGSVVHFAKEFALAAYIRIMHLPFESGASAITAAVGGVVQMLIVSMPAV
jgi:tripartite-type tricarboxylate transporter receptor subunit TctC